MVAIVRACRCPPTFRRCRQQTWSGGLFRTSAHGWSRVKRWRGNTASASCASAWPRRCPSWSSGGRSRPSQRALVTGMASRQGAARLEVHRPAAQPRDGAAPDCRAATPRRLLEARPDLHQARPDPLVGRRHLPRRAGPASSASCATACPAESFETVRNVVEAELGKPLEAVFDEVRPRAHRRGVDRAGARRRR